MRLYYFPTSFNARRAVMTVHELGIDVELRLVDLAKGAQRAPDFLRMNPAGKVPVLDDDGFYLSESCAIMKYLADATPGQTLYPSAPRARARVDQWLFFSAHHVSPAVGAVNWERVVKGFLGLGGPDPALVARGEVLFGEAMRTLEAQLEEGPWVLGAGITLADLAISAPLMATAPAKLSLAPYPLVGAWLERVRARDAWKKTDV